MTKCPVIDAPCEYYIERRSPTYQKLALRFCKHPDNPDKIPLLNCTQALCPLIQPGKINDQEKA